MSFTQIKTCLDILEKNPTIKNYIVQFNFNSSGFMYTVERDPYKNQINQQMNELLDDGSHSGASWGMMLRTIQAILNGVLPYEEFLDYYHIEQCDNKQCDNEKCKNYSNDRRSICYCKNE